MNRQYTTFLISLCLFLSMAYGPLLAQPEVSDDKFTMTIEGNEMRIPYFSTHDIYTPNSTIDKAIIVIQGANRNAGPYLDNLKIAASNASVSTSNTLMVSPQFLIEDDIDFHNLDASHLFWSNGGWKSGSNSRSELTNPRPVRIPSYAVLDSLLLHIAQYFPELESIVFTGHSAGGQVTQRMAATSPMTDVLCEDFGISTRYVPINPSSYVYMDRQRRVAGSNDQFAIPSTSCNDYNEWKYGLDDLFTYPDRSGADSIRRMYKRREVVYLIGEEDNNPNSSSLDDSCEGNLQGAQRLERAEIYHNYIQYYYDYSPDLQHRLSSVPNAGHNSLEMFNSAQGRAILFEEPPTTCGTLVNIITPSIDQSLEVFPNPAYRTLNIQWPAARRSTAIAQIYDLNGRLLLSRPLQAANQLTLHTLSSGLYLLRVQREGISVYRKIVIK